MVVTRRRNDSELSVVDDLNTETPIRRSTRLRSSQNVAETQNKVEVSELERGSSQSKATRGRSSRNRNNSEIESGRDSSADGNQKPEKRIIRSRVDGKIENEPNQEVRTRSVLSNDAPRKRQRTTSSQSLDEPSRGKLVTPVIRRSSRRMAVVDLGSDSDVSEIETPQLRGRHLKVSTEPDLEVLSEEVRPVFVVHGAIQEVSEVELFETASSNDLSKHETERIRDDESQSVKGEELNVTDTGGFKKAEETHKDKADASLEIEKTKNTIQLEEAAEVISEIVSSVNLVVEKRIVKTTDKPEMDIFGDSKAAEDTYMEEKEASLTSFDEKEISNMEEKGTENEALHGKGEELNTNDTKKLGMMEENNKDETDESPDNEAIPEITSLVELVVEKHITTTVKPEVHFCDYQKVAEDSHMDEKESNLTVCSPSLDENEKFNLEEKEKENLHNIENQVIQYKVVEKPALKLDSTTCISMRSIPLPTVPRGKNVSGRFWREPKERFKNSCKDKGLKSSREQYEKNKIERLRIKLLEDRKKEEKRLKIEELRKRQQLNSQRKEINDRRGETVQVIKNTLKLKTLSKKQRRMYQKRDTTGMTKSN